MPKCVYKNVQSADNPYVASLTHKGKTIYIGAYSTIEEASNAVKEARKRYPFEQRKRKEWTEEEKNQLKRLPFPYDDYNRIAVMMGRSVAAIYQKHWKLINIGR